MCPAARLLALVGGVIRRPTINRRIPGFGGRAQRAEPKVTDDMPHSFFRALRKLTPAMLAGTALIAPTAAAAATSSAHANAAIAPNTLRLAAQTQRLGHGVTKALLNSALDNTTGAAEAGKVEDEQLCPAVRNGYASCDIQVLVGKSTHRFIHPHLKRAYSVDRTEPASPFALAAGPLVAQAAGEPASVPIPQSGTPAFFQQAYDLTYLSETQGSSDTVGIVDAYSDPTAASDLATYRTKYGLPACTTANGCLDVVDNATSTNTSWGMETSLDLDAVSAICPLCKIDLIETPSNSYQDLYSGVGDAYTLGAKEISNSWGSPATAGYGPGSSGLSFPSTAILFAAGDDGYTGSPQYPAAYPNVTAVGGTSLMYDPTNARGFDESVWVGSGSGCDTSQSKPAWQTNDSTGCTGRSYNDISADADPNTGLSVYDTGDCGGWCVVGGTSEATPLVSAYYALLGIGPAPSWPYLNAPSLNDITSGNNVDASYSDPTCPSFTGICQAGAGFDGPTGNGTISGSHVAGAPGIGSNGTGAAYVSASTYTATAGVYPNGADTHAYLEYGPTTSYGSQTAAQDVGSGTTPQSVSFNLTELTADQLFHYRVIATNSYGTTYGYDTTISQPAGYPQLISQSMQTIATPTEIIYSYYANVGAGGTIEIEYGTSTAYGSTAAQGTASSGNYVSSGGFLTNLHPDTTYHYAFLMSNSVATVTTADQTFTTPAGVSVALSGIGAITKTSATLNGTVNPQNTSGTAYFVYGTTTAYGQQTGTSSVLSNTTPEAVTQTLTGLQPDTTYHYALVGTSNGETKTSPDATFTTAAGVSVDSVSANATGPTTATLSGMANAQGNANTTVYFQYGTGTTYGYQPAVVPVSGSTEPPESAKITGLQRGTTYHF